MSFATSRMREIVSAVVSSYEVIMAAARVSTMIDNHRAPRAEDLATLGLPEAAFSQLLPRA